MDHFSHLCFVFIFVILSCLFLDALWSPVLGTSLTIGTLVCDVFLCFYHFRIQYPSTGVVLDCIDSQS